MSIRSALAALVLLAALPLAATAQSAMVASLGEVHGMTTANILATARDVPAELYTFAPTEGVRTMGALLGHIADAQYFFCASAAGEAVPQRPSVEQGATTKAEIVAGLEAAFAYCDGVYAEMTDAQAAQPREFGVAPGPMTGASILAFNSAHNYEHYGNLVTYMRMNGIVPPSSR